VNWLASLAWIKPPGYTLEVPSDFNAGEFKLDLPDPLPDGELEFEPLDLPGFQSLELPDFTAFLEDCGPGPNGVTRGRVSGFTAYQANTRARGGEFEPAETGWSPRPRAAAQDHQTGDLGPVCATVAELDKCGAPCPYTAT
jgi:hypothetical protein